jgi:hypothetical protein
MYCSVPVIFCPSTVRAARVTSSGPSAVVCFAKPKSNNLVPFLGLDQIEALKTKDLNQPMPLITIVYSISSVFISEFYCENVCGV